jgi:hypothetical protein
MIAAALAALKGLGIVQWLWTHRGLLKWAAVGLSIAVLAGLWRWERHDRIAAAGIAAAATAQLAGARTDAQRWHDASDLRDRALSGLSDKLALQNAAIAKMQFSLERADQAAAGAAALSRDARAQFDQRIKEIADAAKAHPEQVAPLGIIVLGRVERLWD